MEALDKLTRFVIGEREQRTPLRRVQSGGGQYGRRHGELVRNEIFEKADRQWPARDGTGGRSTQFLVDFSGLGTDRIQCSPDHRAAALGSRTRDEIHQLPPANGGIMAVSRGLAQHGQQTIVETHL